MKPFSDEVEVHAIPVQVMEEQGWRYLQIRLLVRGQEIAQFDLDETWFLSLGKSLSNEMTERELALCFPKDWLRTHFEWLRREAKVPTYRYILGFEAGESLLPTKPTPDRRKVMLTGITMNIWDLPREIVPKNIRPE